MILVMREESRKAVLAVLFVNNEYIKTPKKQKKEKGKRRKGEALCVYSKVYVRVKEGQRRMERKKISLL